MTQPANWFLLLSGTGESALNMAFDEVLLESAPALGQPVLRLYGWKESAATFGYFQKFATVACLTRLRPLIRRPTGGGLVPHDSDWTYSLVFPPSHSWYALRAVESYRRLHEWMRAAFARTGAATTLAPHRRKDIAGQCFAGAEQFDLLWQDRKIAGAAQRRNQSGLLIQGSVQPPPGITKTAWQNAVSAVACSEWGVEWAPLKLESAFLKRAQLLAEQKYGCREYNERC